MGYPLGLAPTADGTGLTPEDHQRVIWSMFRSQDPLIVRGGEVSGTSGMAYAVASGVVYVPTAEDRAVLVPFEGTTVATTAAPSTGSRTDYIYAGIDGAAKVGASVPTGSALLGKRTISAGMTATSAAGGSALDRKYAMLFGASMGRLFEWRDPSPLNSVVNPTNHQLCSAQINLASDRLIDFRLSQTVSSASPASMMWSLYIDGKIEVAYEMGVTTFAETRQIAHSQWILAGLHTIRLEVRRQSGSSDVLYKRGGAASYQGNRFEIIDLGMVW